MPGRFSMLYFIQFVADGVLSIRRNGCFLRLRIVAKFMDVSIAMRTSSASLCHAG